jgi:hypothetical protein
MQANDTRIHRKKYSSPTKNHTHLLSVVHGHAHAGALEVVDVPALLLRAVRGGEGHLELAGLVHHEVRGAVLVPEGVAADHDGLDPAGDDAGDVGDDDGLAKDRAVQDVADGPIGGPPHLLELELLHALLVRRDGGAFDAHVVLLDGVGRVHRHLVVRLVAVGQAQVVVLDLQVQVGQDELVLDLLPDHARHLVTVQVHHGVVHLDLGRHHGRARDCISGGVKKRRGSDKEE